MKKAKHRAETLAFWTALLTFITTITDKVFSMLSKKDAAVVKSDAPVFSVENYAAEPFPWMSVLMWIALVVLVIIIVIKVRRMREINGR